MEPCIPEPYVTCLNLESVFCPHMFYVHFFVHRVNFDSFLLNASWVFT